MRINLCDFCFNDLFLCLTVAGTDCKSARSGFNNKNKIIMAIIYKNFFNEPDADMMGNVKNMIKE